MIRQTRLLKLLLLSLLMLFVGLVGLGLLVFRSLGTLERVDREMLADAAPSIVVLDSAHVKLTALETLLGDRLRRPLVDRVLSDADIAAKRRELGAAVAAYARFPADPGETAARALIDERMEGLDRTIDRIVHPSGRSPDQAEDLGRVLRERVIGLDTALLAASSLNVELLEQASARVRAVRIWVLPTALTLELLCFLAVTFTLAAAYRVVQLAAASSEERERVLEQRMVELDLFSGRVAHDLLSPLTTVSLALGAAEPCVAGAEHPRVKVMMSRAVASLNRVRETVGDLLEFARAGGAPRLDARTDVEPVLQEVVAELESAAEAASVELRAAGGSSLQVLCSAGVLRSVLGNLAQNAIKYIDGGAARRVTVRATGAGAEVRLEVEDTGPGIALEDQEKIFEPYVRRSQTAGGLGLGLATAKRLVEAYGGMIGVVSEVGRGACFWVTLPGVA